MLFQHIYCDNVKLFLPSSLSTKESDCNNSLHLFARLFYTADIIEACQQAAAPHFASGFTLTQQIEKSIDYVTVSSNVFSESEIASLPLLTLLPHSK
jgi:hypothetical protein